MCFLPLLFAHENSFENKKFVLQTDITLTRNTENVGAPSQITHGIGLSYQLPIVTFNTKIKTGFCFLPQISFFYTYYRLNQNGLVIPSELENRMATTLSVLLNLPISYNMIVENNTFHASLGVAFLGRYGFKSTKKVSKPELSIINESFYKNLEWLYPNVTVSYDTKVGNSTLGFSISHLFPLGSLVYKNSMNAAKFMLAFRLGL